jgi:hypothetical protein
VPLLQQNDWNSTAGLYLLSSGQGRWLTIVDACAGMRSSPQIFEFGRRLSAILSTMAITFVLHDNSVFCYVLTSNGKIEDTYKSCPQWFGEKPLTKEEIERERHRPQMLALIMPQATTLNSVKQLLDKGWWNAYHTEQLDQSGWPTAQEPSNRIDEDVRMTQLGTCLELNGPGAEYPYAAWAQAQNLPWQEFAAVRYQRLMAPEGSKPIPPVAAKQEENPVPPSKLENLPPPLPVPGLIYYEEAEDDDDEIIAKENVVHKEPEPIIVAPAQMPDLTMKAGTNTQVYTLSNAPGTDAGETVVNSTLLNTVGVNLAEQALVDIKEAGPAASPPAVPSVAQTPTPTPIPAPTQTQTSGEVETPIPIPLVDEAPKEMPKVVASEAPLSLKPTPASAISRVRPKLPPVKPVEIPSASAEISKPEVSKRSEEPDLKSEKGLKKALKAAQNSSEKNVPELIMLNEKLARLYSESKDGIDWAKSEDYFKKSLELCQGNGDVDQLQLASLLEGYASLLKTIGTRRGEARGMEAQARRIRSEGKQ